MAARRVIRRRRIAKKALRKRGRRVRKRSNLSPANQRATIVETLEYQDLLANTPYQQTFSLANFYRATTLAPNFQFYRAKSVKWEYMPLYNTFQENVSGVAVVSKPQIYTIMNRDQDSRWTSFSTGNALYSLQSAGANPRAFTNNQVIKYKPNWCSPGLQALTYTSIPGTGLAAVTNSVQMGLKKQFGWLSTPDKDMYNSYFINPVKGESNIYVAPLSASTPPIVAGNVLYNGHNLYIEQENNADNVPVCKVVVSVEWEFKGGKNLYNANPVGKVTDVSGNPP